MHTFTNITGPANIQIPLSGDERELTVLFSGRGTYQRGGYAPWPLFELVWNTGKSRIRVSHNKSNQIRCPIGQINLSYANFQDITQWRQYRISITRRITPVREEMEMSLSVDETPLGKIISPVEEGAGESPGISFRHPSEDGNVHGYFGYVIIDNSALEGKTLADIGKEAGIDPRAFPALDDSLFIWEALPPVPESETYPGDAYPFHVFEDGRKGLDPARLSSSGNRVQKLTPGSAGLEKTNGVTVDAAGSGTFRSMDKAIAALPPEGGTVHIRPGIYTEPLLIREKSVALQGEDPFRTIITGYKALVNGIRKNVLVEVGGSPEKPDAFSFSGKNITFYNRGAEWNESINYPERRGAAMMFEDICDINFQNCLFLGRQDTLYLKSGISVFDHCYVEGDIDFICGGATVLFRDCHIHVLPRYPAYITAASPVNEGISPDHPAYAALREKVQIPGFPDLKGFIFYRCLITMDARRTGGLYLGRGPWLSGSGLPEDQRTKIHSETYYIECEFGGGSPFLLEEDGPWTAMDRVYDREIYREYNNTENGKPIPENPKRPRIKPR
ncbi:hypothetical protein AGMMS50255_1550 [Spirochaetia bacterium]|nr:hypothetical protein AGMMS50255_1550 [Spirochaetia bacterium]